MQVDQNKKFTPSLAQLKWACRRGMLELDVLLGNFLNEVYPSLIETKKQQFIVLLSCTDPELFNWLLGREIPKNSTLLPIIEAIRNHAASRARA